MTGHRILVVEDDTGVSTPVRTVLTQRGYQVWVAQDGEEGLRMARQVSPHLLLVDVMMPNMDGWTMLRTLRGQPEFAFTPAIFLTALPVTDTVVDSFRMGGVDYLPKPFKFEDLVARVAQLIQRHEQVEAVYRMRTRLADAMQPAPGLRSRLDQMGLGSLLSVLELDKKTGVLILRRGGESGKVWLRSGRVLRAEVVGRKSGTGPTAVYEMLGWSEGSAEFEMETVDGPDEVKLSTMHLLMEGARVLDESRKPAGVG